MANFGPDQVFCPNFQIVISQESLGVRSWNFQSSHKIKKFWELRVWSSKQIGSYDMELPSSVVPNQR